VGQYCGFPAASTPSRTETCPDWKSTTLAAPFAASIDPTISSGPSSKGA